MSDEANPPDFSACTNIDEVQLAIMETIGYVRKSGQVDSGRMNYKYASEGDFIRAVRPLLIAAKVIVNRPKITVHGAEIVCTYVFKHVPTGTTSEIEVVGDIESGGKGGYKAMTGAQKYALRNWLLIETGDDPEKADKKRGRKGQDTEGDQKRLADGMARIRAAKTGADLKKCLASIKSRDMPESLRKALLQAVDDREAHLGSGGE